MKINLTTILLFASSWVSCPPRKLVFPKEMPVEEAPEFRETTSFHVKGINHRGKELMQVEFVSFNDPGLPSLHPDPDKSKEEGEYLKGVYSYLMKYYEKEPKPELKSGPVMRVIMELWHYTNVPEEFAAMSLGIQRSSSRGFSLFFPMLSISRVYLEWRK